jgi:penicillin-binding protein 1A
VTELPVPEGLLNVGNEWFYDEYAKGASVSSLGMAGNNGAAAPAFGTASGAVPITVLPPADEKKRILDLFKN